MGDRGKIAQVTLAIGKPRGVNRVDGGPQTNSGQEIMQQHPLRDVVMNISSGNQWQLSGFG